MDLNNPSSEEMRDELTYRDYVAGQLREQGGRLSNVEASIDTLNLRSEEIYQILTLAKGFFKFCIILGHIAKWVAGIATASLAVWKLAEQFAKSHWPWS